MNFTGDCVATLYALVGVFMFSAIAANVNQIAAAIERLW